MNPLIKKIVLGLIWFVFSLAGCSPYRNQPPVSIGATLPPPSITVIPHANQALDLAAVETWPEIARYGLAGHLVLILFNQQGNRLIELNLQSGEIKTLFQAPENSWFSEALVSPDHQQIILTYATPPPNGETQFGYADLYILPYDGSSQPKPFLARSDPKESFFNPSWSPEGQSVYYTHLYRIDPTSQVPAYQNDIEKTNLTGQTETILNHALWPVVSPDGSKIAYLLADPVTLGNDLYLANPDGSEQTPVLQPGNNPPVDAHLFTMDGTRLIFSMVDPQPAPAKSWLDKWFGIETASAHNVPSDWYRAPLSGGLALRLTNLEDVNLNGGLSPDGSHIAFISATGLYIMDIDGNQQIQLTNNVLIGTVNWIP